MKDEEARALYWKAVEALRELIESGTRSLEDIIEELREDL
jgi:hypothetical protein